MAIDTLTTLLTYFSRNTFAEGLAIPLDRVNIPWEGLNNNSNKNNPQITSTSDRNCRFDFVWIMPCTKHILGYTNHYAALLINVGSFYTFISGTKSGKKYYRKTSV